MDRPPLRCWKCDYDLTGLDSESECPECGTAFDPGPHPGESMAFGYAALICGVLSVPMGLTVILTGADSWPGPVFTSLSSFLLASLALVLGSRAEPRWARKLNIRPEYSVADLGRLVAFITLVFLGLFWIPVILSLVL